MSIIDDARAQLDAADIKITTILAQFRKAAQPLAEGEVVKLPPSIIQIFKDRASPLDLINIVMRHVDPHYAPEAQLTELAGGLCDRYDTVLKIACYKRDNPSEYKGRDGLYHSYVEKRHKEVVARNLEGVVRLGGDAELGQVVCDAIPAYCVKIQDEYLNYQAGPIAETLASQPS